MLPFCPNDFDDNNITKIAARAEESRQLARVHTLRAQDKDRRRYDSKHQMVSYAPGDLVGFILHLLNVLRNWKAGGSSTMPAKDHALKEARAPALLSKWKRLRPKRSFRDQQKCIAEDARRLSLPPSSVRNILRRILQLYP
ncbi:transposon Ty3-I Gag-Pol polyprotein [Trichonephila clavipes]|nr:transposon Ty3-I Gag-Pol polyprotein [Trichonephila clavipes]